MKWLIGILAVVGLGVGLVYLAAWLNQTTFRYRMTVDVDVDGKVHSGSSVIEVNYTFGSDGLGMGNLRSWYATVRGVAPIIDIGRYGTLVAALGYDGEDFARRDLAALQARFKPDQLHSGIVTGQDAPLVAFKLRPQDLHKAKGAAALKSYSPAFIWIRPPGDDWRNSRQLLPEQFSKWISPSVRLENVTIERADRAELLVQVLSPQTWLVKLRQYTRTDRSAVAPTEPFAFGLNFVETEYQTVYTK